MISISAIGKESLKKSCEDGFYNNIKITLLDGSGMVIENENIVGESLKMTERMCSGGELKFGLCEAKSLELECLDIQDIKGKDFLLEIEKINEKTGEAICVVPYGVFSVKSCKKQSFDGRRSITAYDQLNRSTLDINITEKIQSVLDEMGSMEKLFVRATPYHIKTNILSEYLKLSDEKTIKITSDAYGTMGVGPITNIPVNAILIEYYTVTFHSNISKKKYYKFIMKMKKNIVDRNIEKIYNKAVNLSRESERAKNMEKEIRLQIECDAHYEGEIYGTRTIYQEWGEAETESLTNITSMRVKLPYKAWIAKNLTSSNTTEEVVLEAPIMFYRDSDNVQQITGNWDNLIDVREIDIPIWETEEIKEIGDATIREVISSFYELNVEFGKENRITGLVEGVRLNNGGLAPRDALYPKEGLYPYGGNSIQRGEIEDVWIDENGAVKYGKLKIHYKEEDPENEESSIEKIYEHVFNEDIDKTYEVESNWFLDNVIMTEDQVEEIAEKMAERIRRIEIYPFRAEMTGLPYLETGDMIEIPDGSNAIKKVFILERTISGIQDLKDSMEAMGGGI